MLAALTLLAAPATSAGEHVETAGAPIDPRFGVIESFWGPDEADELNVGWDRILFYWNEIQPAGPDDWNTLHVLEEWLVEAEAQDRVVLGLLKNTPAWATDGAPFSGVPRGLYLDVDDPDNLWAGYVRKVMRYYAPRGVHNWIVWNEPEIDPGVYGHEFGGTTSDYFQLLKVAYLVAKEEDPDAVIHLAGWSYWHDPGWLDEFLRVATSDADAAANRYYFDTITLHIYFRVETVAELVDEVWRIQERYGLRKPIWINETNASPNLDPGWPVVRPQFPTDLDQQAWFIVQAHALGFGSRASRVGVYKLVDVLLPEGGESFGIVRPDFSQRPAFDAYRTTVEYLSGFTYPVITQEEPAFYNVAFKRPQGVTRVLWARQAADVIIEVPALAEEALIVSASGLKRPIRAVEGVYPIKLPGARCYDQCNVGGPPIFLVEFVPDQLPGYVRTIPTIDASTVVVTPAPRATLPATPAPTPAAAATPGG